MNGAAGLQKKRASAVSDIGSVSGDHRGLVKSGLGEPEEAEAHGTTYIYTRLVEEEGFRGSEVNVRRYVRLAKASLGAQPRERRSKSPPGATADRTGELPEVPGLL